MIRRALVGVALLAAVVNASCSGSDDEPDPGAAGSTPASTAASTADSATEPSSPGTGDGVRPEGFTTIMATITGADGEVCEVCLWLADDGDERGRGLMGVTDLGAAAGMAFRFDEARIGTFYMYRTPTPLSIAWFGPDGGYVGSADMAPCLDTPAEDCPRYSPDQPYDLAIEVFAGGLEPLGLGPGSSVELIDGTEAERCPAAT